MTALMASSGFLWIGTSNGMILIYRIPYLEGIPIISGKPYLAMDGHKAAVRVLLPVKTKATISSSRVSQFLSDEQRRFSTISQPDEEEEGEGEIGASETLGKNETLTGDGSKILLEAGGILAESEEEEEEREKKEGGAAGAGGVLLQDVVDSVSGAAGSREEEEEVEGEENEEADERSPTSPFPLMSPPPTEEENDKTCSQASIQSSGQYPDDQSGPQYQLLEEEEEDIQLVKQDQQVTEQEKQVEENGQTEQDRQVNPVTAEPEEQFGDETNEELTKAMAEEDASPQDKVEQMDTINGSAEFGVGEEKGEKLNSDEPPHDFVKDSPPGSAGKDEEIFGVVRQNGSGEGEREGGEEHLSNGFIDESGIYSAPVELDRIPRPTRAMKKKEEEIYSIPHEILPPSVSKRTVVPAGYENPSALNEKGGSKSMYVP